MFRLCFIRKQYRQKTAKYHLFPL